MPKFTRSVDGVQRATVKIGYRVDQHLFDWIASKVGARQAWTQIRNLLFDLGREGLDWRVWCYKDGEVRTVHVDDCNIMLNDGYEVFTRDEEL